MAVQYHLVLRKNLSKNVEAGKEKLYYAQTRATGTCTFDELCDAVAEFDRFEWGCEGGDRPCDPVPSDVSGAWGSGPVWRPGDVPADPDQFGKCYDR